MNWNTKGNYKLKKLLKNIKLIFIFTSNYWNRKKKKQIILIILNVKIKR